MLQRRSIRSRGIAPCLFVAAATLVVAGCQEADSSAPADDAPTGGKGDDPGQADDLANLLCSDDFAATIRSTGVLQHSNPDWQEPTYLNAVGAWQSIDLRQRWNHQNQGTQIIPLSWLLALQEEGGSQAILSDANLQQYGFLPDHETRCNPFELPVGMSIQGSFDAVEDGDGNLAQEPAFFGYTCAACHTGSMKVDGQEFRIAAGAGLQDVARFNQDLVKSLGKSASLDLDLLTGILGVPQIEISGIESRKERFIAKIRDIQTKIYGKAQTVEQVQTALAQFDLRRLLALQAVEGEVRTVEFGPGRLDALGNGGNTMFGRYLEKFHGGDGKANMAELSGQVGLPPVYDAPKWDWAQYTHSIHQSFGRNLAEAIAVNSPTSLTGPDEDGWNTTASAEGLAWIEEHLRLASGPAYPTQWSRPDAEEHPELPGVTYGELRQTGAQLFWQDEDVACARCHSPRNLEAPGTPNPDGWQPGQVYNLNTLTVGVIGTDPKTASNFAERTVTLPDEVIEALTPFSPIEGSLFIPGDSNLYSGIVLNALVNAVGSSLFERHGWGDYLGQAAGRGHDATQGRPNLFRMWVDDLPPELDPVIFKPEEGFDAGDPRCDTNESGDLDGGEINLCQLLREDTGWLVYRARPLNGMWNTAPFLHNNSVPSLCALLGNETLGDEDGRFERTDHFNVGSTDFDLMCLGYDSSPGSKMPDGVSATHSYSIDRPGNLNTGHRFSDEYLEEGVPKNGVIGRALTKQEIFALIEFIKTLPPLPAGM